MKSVWFFAFLAITVIAIYHSQWLPIQIEIGVFYLEELRKK